jgi:hypothetical protein
VDYPPQVNKTQSETLGYPVYLWEGVEIHDPYLLKVESIPVAIVLNGGFFVGHYFASTIMDGRGCFVRPRIKEEKGAKSTRVTYLGGKVNCHSVCTVPYSRVILGKRNYLAPLLQYNQSEYLAKLEENIPIFCSWIREQKGLGSSPLGHVNITEISSCLPHNLACNTADHIDSGHALALAVFSNIQK